QSVPSDLISKAVCGQSRMPENLAPLFVEKKSLDWALAHIKHFGDSDIFPDPFEFEAYSAVWDGVREYLACVDLPHVDITRNLKIMIAKYTEGFRGASQLNPFHALLYSALIYESARDIEACRKPRDVACAYRLELGDGGRLFKRDSGWGEFHRASEKLIKDRK